MGDLTECQAKVQMRESDMLVVVRTSEKVKAERGITKMEVSIQWKSNQQQAGSRLNSNRSEEEERNEP